MPGAISGRVVSIEAEKGTIETRRGTVAFSLENDALQSSDLRDEYAVGCPVVFFVDNKNNSNPDGSHAHIVCPERHLKAGYGVVDKVERKYAMGRNESGDSVFFSVGRLSKSLPESDDRDLREVVKPGDRFRYRAMPPKKGDCLRACNVKLSSNRPYFTNSSYTPRTLDRSVERNRDRRHRNEEHRSRSPHRRRRHSEEDGDRISRHHSPSDEHNSLRGDRSPRRPRSTKRESSDDVDCHARRELSPKRPSRSQTHCEEEPSTKRRRRTSSLESEDRWTQVDLQSLMENAYIRAHNLLSSSCDNDDTIPDDSQLDNKQPLLTCEETQTDPFPARMLGQMLLSDKALVQLLTKERPDILAAAIDAVNLQGH
uniref:Uncharacterized protein n=1 Tax=Plectus sambesii TaxID=2011161 RepID=A0A914W8Y0_9BILA